MQTQATGTFKVALEPQADQQLTDANIGRMFLDKEFQGDLEAISRGQMISVMDQALGSGAYSAIERVTGTLKGKKGTFALQHTGIMDKGKPQLTIAVVPDSGTDELKGLSGTMEIIIENGSHSFRFAYVLPEAS